MNDKRPKVKVPKSKNEKVLELASLLIIIISWVYLIISWHKISHKVPAHFGFSGKADSWGSKNSIIADIAISSALYLLLWIVSKFPQSYNYPAKITEENAERQYQNARTLMLWMNLEITSSFFYLEYKTIAIGINQSGDLGLWYLPIFLVVLFGTMGFYIHRMKKLK